MPVTDFQDLTIQLEGGPPPPVEIPTWLFAVGGVAAAVTIAGVAYAATRKKPPRGR